MIILDATTKSLKIVLGEAATTQLAITAHYTDVTTITYVPGSNDTVTNSTTVVEFVAAPAASTQRHIEAITVYNSDNVVHIVNIQYVSAGGTRQIIKSTLQVGMQLSYEHGMGWKTIDTAGGIVSGANVSDEAYGAGWDGVTSVAPSKNAVYDKIEALDGEKLDNPGAWTTPAFSAGNFTGSDSMTWTVASGDVGTYAYQIIGKTMVLAINLNATTVGGTPAVALRVTIPASKTATKGIVSGLLILDNLVRSIGIISIAAGQTYISFQKTDNAAWTASTDQTYVLGEITFEIN
jgi:hypothetical protein